MMENHRRKATTNGCRPSVWCLSFWKSICREFYLHAKGELAECIVYLKMFHIKGKHQALRLNLIRKDVFTHRTFLVFKLVNLVNQNSDATLHNIHSMPKTNKEFNFAMPKVVKTKKAKFDSAEDPFYIKCDVHPWMKTWVLVSDHPYYAVTDSNGNYEIKGVPAGTYEVICWQENSKKAYHR